MFSDEKLTSFAITGIAKIIVRIAVTANSFVIFFIVDKPPDELTPHTKTCASDSIDVLCGTVNCFENCYNTVDLMIPEGKVHI